MLGMGTMRGAEPHGRATRSMKSRAPAIGIAGRTTTMPATRMIMNRGDAPHTISDPAKTRTAIVTEARVVTTTLNLLAEVSLHENDMDTVEEGLKNPRA